MPAPTGPHLCYALAARQNARHLSRLYDNHLAPAGLSVSQFSILSLLESYESLKITELAHMLSMERTTLVRALKPLQAAGWVLADRADSGRSFDVGLSPPASQRWPRPFLFGRLPRPHLSGRLDRTVPSASAMKFWN